MHVLHLLDEADRHAARACLSELAHAARVDAASPQPVLLAAGPELVETAQALGLTDVQRVRVPRHRPMLGLPALHRAIKQVGPVDIIHTWSADARRAVGLIRRGHPARHGRGPTPWVDDALIDGSQRQGLRERWGVGPQACVVAVVSGSADRTPAMAAALGVGMARECLIDEARSTPSLRLLLHPASAGLSKTLALLRDVGWSDALIQDAVADRPWACGPAIDAAVLLGDAGAGDWPLWAAACGVPIIAERGGAVAEALAADGGALLVDPGLPRQVAANLLELQRDPQRVAALCDAARRVADERFSRESARLAAAAG